MYVPGRRGCGYSNEKSDATITSSSLPKASPQLISGVMLYLAFRAAIEPRKNLLTITQNATYATRFITRCRNDILSVKPVMRSGT